MRISRALSYGVIVTGIAAMVGPMRPTWVSRVAYATEGGQAAAAREQLKRVRDLSLAFQEVTKATKPSVVSIRSIRKTRMSLGAPQPLPLPGPFNDPFNDDFFERFFGDRFRRENPSEERVQQGYGTGVIVSEDGHILTNNHVVAGADRITVALSDGRQLNADVVGTDDKTDLAVLVEPGGAAERAGLRAGDIIIRVGSQPVETLREFEAELAVHDLEQGVRLRVRSEGMQRFVVLRK